MPVTRSDFSQTSFERKMRAYLTAYAAKAHERHFGWNSLRVLTVTTDAHRLRLMTDVLKQLHVPHSPGPGLFLFATRADLGLSNPLLLSWQDGHGRERRLI
jgi:hypothetical protein